MKTQIFGPVMMALCLAACSSEPAKTDTTAVADKAAAQTAAPEAAEVIPASAPGTAGAISRDFMIGKWAEEKDGDCVLAQEFKPDGTVDGFFDSWSLEGSKLVIKVLDETLTMGVTIVDPKRIDIEADGKTQRLIRC